MAEDDWFKINRASWNERVPIHVRSDFYGVEGFKAGNTSLSPREIEDLGSVEGKDLVHLQCHFGLDTLSWARLGATVTGLDFSQAAIEQASGLADEIGVDATFVCANVYDAPKALGRQFDIVYTGLGALNWLPDIGRWASTVATLLRAGGELYLFEFHPTLWIFDEESMNVKYDYFTPPEGLEIADDGTYADPDAPIAANQTREWNHSIAEVVSALLAAGLELRELRESDSVHVQPMNILKPDGNGLYRTNPVMPVTFTLRAAKP